MPASSTVRLVDVAPQPWRNGGGETRALLVRPRGDRWQVRVSVADVDVNGPFSRFPGVERWFAVLEGAGVVLTIGDKEHPLGPEDDALSFRGDAVVRCRLVDGPTRDLNLMLSGLPGAMRRVASGQAWRPGTRECGLYATRAGHCAGAAAGEREPMPANALRWWPEAPDSLVFDGAGWWLGAGAKSAAP
jgi:uncharacterized protein